MRFTCSQHPKRKGKSLNARLRTKSIGVSPSRLHCGRTASYGSIIIPCTCLCHLQEQPGFLLYKTLSLASPGRSWRFYNLGLGLPDTSNVSNECVFSCHGVEVLPLTNQLGQIFEKLQKNFQLFQKIFNRCKKISPSIIRWAYLYMNQ